MMSAFEKYHRSYYNYNSYQPAQPAPQSEAPPKRKMEEDTEEVASFLLSLKHRSVTPEPSATASVEPYYQHYSPQPVASFAPLEQPAQKAVDKTPPALMMEDAIAMGGDIPVEGLLGDSKLVLTKDRDLVPDALFVAMAQMRPCKLTQADRVGCYKSREVGFVGMCCIHCSGQPGFGRYYPNSVRSLAQTTTSQTILKHVGNKCRFCPPHIRQAVNELQRQQAAREGMSTGRPRYGSRKIFFQRVWARLHGGPMMEEDDASSNQTPSDLESEIQSRQSSPATSDDESSLQHLPKSVKRKFGALPTQKNLKRSLAAAADEDENSASKRPRFLTN
ncbi:expressed unknown protein [Seminavis robusta]|uniref:Uncharacterized protein n=1 Tax=Seminavis robusta TaxID=568900 RepID=A0A9N8DJS0_9STRA|nr:expressed unknown protein [Seminavis robusta]|eukprot:Sro196_g083620.1 n/a (333) ;mRNA; f:74784-75782